MKFDDIKNNKNIYLYHGDLDPRNINKNKIKFIGLSINKCDNRHIRHDVNKKLDLLDNSVDILQTEDVLEHIEYDNLVKIFNEIYRVLKPGGLFRLSVPDYRCDIFYNRTIKRGNELIFDPGGGGKWNSKKRKVINGGHVWFPNYEKVLEIYKKSDFDMDKVEFLEYYDQKGNPVMKGINYEKGYIARTSDNDDRVQNPKRTMSVVVDCYK